jgi:hypothetical protein
MKADDFNFDEVGTRFQGDTLVVYYKEYYLTIERFFYIVAHSGIVTLNDFKGNVL